MDNMKAARELFLKYGGSHYQMARENEYEPYRSYHITKQQELDWAQEQERSYLEQLIAEPDAYRIERLVSALTFYFHNYPDPAIAFELLAALRSKLPLLDSFSKVLVSERVLDMVARPSATEKLVEAGRQLASDLLQSVLANPIVVAPAYTDQQHLADFVTPVQIRLRAERGLKRCRP